MSIRKQYDTDLESLKNSLTEMGRNSADAVENALEALCVADADAAAAIVKGDARDVYKRQSLPSSPTTPVSVPASASPQALLTWCSLLLCPQLLRLG